MASKPQAVAPDPKPASEEPRATPNKVARALRQTASKSQQENRVDTGLTRPDGNRDAFAAMLRQAVPDESVPSEAETSDRDAS